MDDRTTALPRLEVALAHLKRQEESLWGKTQIRSHQWLARLERSSLLQRLAQMRRRTAGIPSLREEPAFDVDSLLVISLLFHLLLLFAMAQIKSRPALPTSPEPIVVRLLDSGSAPAEPRKAQTKTTPAPARLRKQPAAPPPQAPESVAAPAQPEPAPTLPAPKVLAQLPASRETTLNPPPIETLIQLPTRPAVPQSGSLATAIDPLPESLAGSKGLPSEPARRQESAVNTGAEGSPTLAALSNPDFGSYLEMIKRRVQSVWNYPEGVNGTHRIDVLFVIDRGGKLVRIEVLDSSDPRLRSSAVQAMKRASPFPPIPDSLKDLAGWPLRMRFSVDFGVKVTQ